MFVFIPTHNLKYTPIEKVYVIIKDIWRKIIANKSINCNKDQWRHIIKDLITLVSKIQLISVKKFFIIKPNLNVERLSKVIKSWINKIKFVLM